jgi:enterochelin esterase-like enzyme
MGRVRPAPTAAAPPPPEVARSRPGRTTELEVDSRPLHATVRVTLWSPAGAGGGETLPVLAVHDGPEYVERVRICELACGWIGEGRAPAHRIALLHPGEREEWYSASALYARALVGDVLPAIAEAARAVGPPVGLGASLGALAMLHAQRRHPEALSGLFLQSGSFFTPRYDHTEKGFARYGRIVRFVRSVVREQEFERPVPAVLTCGADEDNVHNNRRVAAALALQGYGAPLHERPGGHGWPVWAEGVRAHLPRLLTAAWAPDG